MKNGVPEHDVVINQGDDFYKTVKLEKGDKPLDITDCTFKFAGRYNLTDKKLAFTGQIELLDSNTIRLYIPNEVTGKLQANTDYKIPKKLYYDVQLIRDGNERRILQGVAYVYAGNAYKVTGLDDVPENVDHVRDLISKEVSKIADIDLSAVNNLSKDVERTNNAISGLSDDLGNVRKSLDEISKGMITADQVSKLIDQQDHLSTEQVQSIVNNAINALDGEEGQY